MYPLNPLLKIESYASTTYDTSKLDFKKIELLIKYNNLLESLDKWILTFDRNEVSNLIKLSEIVDKIYLNKYPFIKQNILYRGFGSSYQNDMGLFVKSFFSKKLDKNVKIGYEFKYNVKQPISFSWDINIAEEFGNIVVSSKLPATKKLVITDELSYLINKRRNLKHPETQNEVIILPNNILNCKVIRL